MDINTKRKSFHKSLYELEEKSTRRRSLFEVENETLSNQEKPKETYLKEWDSIWGHYKSDFVNVVKYPEKHVETVQEELDQWKEKLKKIDEKLGELIVDTEYLEVMENCELSEEQKVILQDIDSKIACSVSNSEKYLKASNVSADIVNRKLKQIKEEVEFEGKYVALSRRRTSQETEKKAE